MAVPKSKVSKQRGNSRFAQWKLTAPNLTECPQCKTMILPHRVCPNCGYYNGRQVVVPKEDKKEN
ncbi:MAG TPA: 50S ribosomal protein L32 [Candidatus Stercoripulliclostridium merdigallinarum]|uniref:Large ribosomal subunit protein bL32 n=1 Tax=Candidatus Stercoripulliclostridium merdigallinarum TaxID=2840951 RepID=A0A9D1MHW1_9FIRM|nr:50S ribosomal protein L32 [Candidatus Stercoripulliclostridium merdigallinarum]